MHHYILDNGSKDGTPDYLSTITNQLKGLVLCPHNVGLHKGTQLISSIMLPCNYVLKVDNDCFFEMDRVIGQLVGVAEKLRLRGEGWILSPYVGGIVHQPKRGQSTTIQVNECAYTLSPTGQVGGLCMLIPYGLFKLLQFNVNLPLAKGLDSQICLQAVTHGYRLGYIDNLEVFHYETTDGQARRYPEYFKRKKREELTA